MSGFVGISADLEFDIEFQASCMSFEVVLASECKDILTALVMIFLAKSLLNDESRHRKPSMTIFDSSMLSDIAREIYSRSVC